MQHFLLTYKNATNIPYAIAYSAPAIDIIYIAYVWPNISSKLSEANKIKNVIANNIISIEISISIIFLLFKTNPSIPIKKSINDKLIFL